MRQQHWLKNSAWTSKRNIPAVRDTKFIGMVENNTDEDTKINYYLF